MLARDHLTISTSRRSPAATGLLLVCWSSGAALNPLTSLKRRFSLRCGFSPRCARWRVSWEALLAQLRGVHVDVSALKRALKAADEEDTKRKEEEGDDPLPDQDDSQAAKLLAIAGQYEYFCSEFGLPYMSVELGSRLETIRIRSRKAKLFFIHQYVLAFGKPPADATLRGVLDTLEARASFDGVVHPVYIRHARHDSKIYLDRGTEDGSAWEIDRHGPRIVPRPPVRFLRPAGMLPLPEAVLVDPKEGLRRLKELTLFRTERDPVLGVGFMLDALGGVGPFSVLLIIGEGGAAKSTWAKIIVALVDPRLLPLLNAPASKRDLYINASTRALVAYNNLSYLDKSISDGLCTATEGGAESRRALFTDDDESLHPRQGAIHSCRDRQRCHAGGPGQPDVENGSGGVSAGY